MSAFVHLPILPLLLTFVCLSCGEMYMSYYVCKQHRNQIFIDLFATAILMKLQFYYCTYGYDWTIK